MTVSSQTRCRVCATELPVPYLDLGVQPMANGLLDHPTDPAITAPLAVALCPDCGLSQLTVTVDPTVLYANYPFYSGTSPAWAAHCRALARSVPVGGLVVDIAANDGTQLLAFNAVGWRCVGVEPADTIPAPLGIPMVRRFFDESVAVEIRDLHGPADVVIAQNVLGHVQDPVGFLRGVSTLLASQGQAVVEVPDVYDLIGNLAFDTIYHEHLNYWSARAMRRACWLAGLVIDHVDPLPAMHGGSRRYWLRRRVAPRPEVRPLNTALFQEFGDAVETHLSEVQSVLDAIQSDGRSLWAFGASAKGTVMLNALAHRANLVRPTVIVDDAPSKQGRYSPGLHIPIRPLSGTVAPDDSVCWLLSWNWADSIVPRLRKAGFAGRVLVTQPTIRNID